MLPCPMHPRFQLTQSHEGTLRAHAHAPRSTFPISPLVPSRAGLGVIMLTRNPTKDCYPEGAARLKDLSSYPSPRVPVRLPRASSRIHVPVQASCGSQPCHYRRSGRNGPPLQGTEEFEEGVFFGGREFFEFFGDLSGFAAVAQDGVGKGKRSAIVHQAGVEAEAPERGGAHFFCGLVEFVDREIFPSDRVHLFAVVLGHGLDDAVAAADVVEE